MKAESSILQLWQDTQNYSLKADARVQRELRNDVVQLLESKDFRQFLTPNKKPSPEEVLDWWKTTHGAFPKELIVFQSFLEQGEYPVFCTISLIISTSAPTIFLPIPFKQMQWGLEGFKNSIWINAPQGGGADYKKRVKRWEVAGRYICHAMANISYSVRIGDNPVLGYLALAHTEGKVVYIPDVSKVRNGNGEMGIKNSDDVLSAAIHDEKFLGMASVIYIPLFFPGRLEEVELSGNKYHQAVLAFWSPAPHFWDHLFGSRLEEQAVYTLRVKPRKKITSNHFLHRIEFFLSKQLSWLSREIETYNFVDRIIASNTTNLIVSLDRSFKDASKNEVNVWKSVSHEFSTILRFITKDVKVAETPLEDAMKAILIGQESSLRRLHNWGFINLDSFRILFRINGSYAEKFTYEDRHSVLEKTPEGISISIDEKVVNFILTEPLKNIFDYAYEIYEIEIWISKNYLSVLYKQKTKAEAVKRLTRNKESFKTYYSLRRGLPINPHSSNYGLGIHLFNTLTTDLKIAKRLYMSPDGKFCWSEIWLPLTRKSP